MNEGDGKMMFIPDRVEVKRGEQIRFVLPTTASWTHEFMLASTDGQSQARRTDEEDIPTWSTTIRTARRCQPKKNSEILWRFTKARRSSNWLPHPGHREAGMTGTIIVK